MSAHALDITLIEDDVFMHSWEEEGCQFDISVVCTCSVQTDAWFELISVVMDMAIWHTKHAAVIAASDR